MKTICEVCGSSTLTKVLDLGGHPLCDDLVRIDDTRICRAYPIQILLCERCFTAFQSTDVNKEELFSQSYHYRSRFTGDVVSGMESLVGEIENILGELNGMTVIDVGCNDGSLLNIFYDKKCITVGVEPTGAIIDADNQKHKLYNEFFDVNVALRIKKECGIPDIITFTNVFAHIENLPALLDALEVLMGDETVLIIENHYLGSVLEKHQFDTFYHEHPRTYSLKSFLEIADKLRCVITGLEFPNRYGGNIRVSLSRNKQIATNDEFDTVIQEVLRNENTFPAQFKEMEKFIDRWKIEKKTEIVGLVEKHGKMPCKAFPGRAAILIKLLELDETHISAVYEKPGSMKIGHFVPGTRIPILSDDDLFQINPSVILNLAWHIESEILSYLRKNNISAAVINIL